MTGMTGNVREFDGIFTAFDADAALGARGRAALFNPRLTIDVDELGSLYCDWFTDDVEEAKALVGRRVRVTVEILDV